MIEEGKYYLCVRDFVNQERKEDINNHVNNEFLDYLFEYGYKVGSPQFIVGTMYRSDYDGYLTDSVRNQILIEGENIDAFIDINFEISPNLIEKIKDFNDKGVKVEIIPRAFPKGKICFNADTSITINDVDIDFVATIRIIANRKFGFWAIGSGVGSTQIEAFNIAWKKFRINSPLIKKLYACLRYYGKVLR